MKKLLLAALFCISWQFAFSQDSLQKNRTAQLINYEDSSMVVIKGDEIRRFPSANFLDALNGLYPWIFSQTPDANNFLFVINGFILPDINGLSLYDIDEVIFTRNSLNGSLYPYFKAGTFFIKTKTATSNKPIINFNSQYNTQWNKKALLRHLNFHPSTAWRENHSNNKYGNFLSNHISLASGGRKSRFYASAQYDAIKEPPLDQQSFYGFAGSTNTDTTSGNMRVNQYNLKSFISLEYSFTSRLKAGITGNYFLGHNKEKISDKYQRQGYLDSITKSLNSTLSYYHIGSFINWVPLQRLRNKLYFEYGENQLQYKNFALLYTGFFSNTTTREAKIQAYSKRYTLRNQLDYDFLYKKKFKMTGTVIFNYLRSNVSSKIDTIIGNNLFITKQFNYRNKLTSLNPMIHFSWNNILSGYTGYAVIINKGISMYDHRYRSNHYAGVTLNMKSLLKLKNLVSHLDIFFNYGDMSQNTHNSYWLPVITDPANLKLGSRLNADYYPYNATLIGSPSLLNVIFKNRLTAFGINSGFNKKIMAGIAWSELWVQKVYLLRLAQFNNAQYIAKLGNETQNGLSFFTAGKLMDKPRRKWDIRLNMLFPHIKYYINDTTKPEVYPINYSLQAGLQNKFQFGNWHIQVNVLCGLNREYYINYSTLQQVQKKFNEFILNYLLFAYDLSKSKNSFFKNMSVFAHGRNLLSSKKAREYYQYNSFAGIGLNLKLK